MPPPRKKVKNQKNSKKIALSSTSQKDTDTKKTKLSLSRIRQNRRAKNNEDPNDIAKTQKKQKVADEDYSSPENTD